MAARFGLERGLGDNLASALGSNEVTLLQLTTAYAMLVNGGKRHRAGADRAHPGSARPHRAAARRAALSGMPERRLDRSAGAAAARPARAGDRSRALVPDGQHAAGRGRARHRRRARWRSASRSPARPARPTTSGTPGSSASRRTWWSASTSASTSPRPWAPKSRAPAPRCRSSSQFMEAALKDQPATPFRVPPGVRLVRVDADTGRLAGPGTSTAILEAYLPGTEPTAGSTGRGIAPAGNEHRRRRARDRPAAPADRRPVLSRRLRAAVVRLRAACYWRPPEWCPRQPQAVSDHARRDQPSRRGDRAGHRPAEEASLTGTARSNASTS